MRSIKDDMYDEAFRLWDMVPAGTVPGYGSAGSVYRFANGCGHGEYWAYFHDNLFAVNAFWPQFLGTLVQAVGSGAVFTVLALALDRAGGKARLAPHSQG